MVLSLSALATWDFDMIHKCVCDATYMGHDCDIRSCPTGPDPMVQAGAGATFEVNRLQAYRND
jgi:hypothetical protein